MEPLCAGRAGTSVDPQQRNVCISILGMIQHSRLIKGQLLFCLGRKFRSIASEALPAAKTEPFSLKPVQELDASSLVGRLHNLLQRNYLRCRTVCVSRDATQHLSRYQSATGSGHTPGHGAPSWSLYPLGMQLLYQNNPKGSPAE